MSLDVIDLHFTHEPWVLRSACSGLAGASSLFFPEQGQPTEAAKAVCATCPVREECLAYALRTVQRHGIWGGTSERERRQMRRLAKSR